MVQCSPTKGRDYSQLVVIRWFFPFSERSTARFSKDPPVLLVGIEKITRLDCRSPGGRSHHGREEPKRETQRKQSGIDRVS